jgi:hypothetical protein
MQALHRTWTNTRLVITTSNYADLGYMTYTPYLFPAKVLRGVPAVQEQFI